MSQVLHRAILDGIQHTPGYEARGILVTTALEATCDLGAHAGVLYQSVYTILGAMPGRLVRGSRFQVTTVDVDDGIQLAWEAREEATVAPGAKDVHGVLTYGPYGDLVGIALRALERFCHLRAGHLESRFHEVHNSSSFAQPSYIVRRVVAYIPCERPSDATPQAMQEPEATPSRRDHGKSGPGHTANPNAHALGHRPDHRLLLPILKIGP